MHHGAWVDETHNRPWFHRDPIKSPFRFSTEQNFRPCRKTIIPYALRGFALSPMESPPSDETYYLLYDMGHRNMRPVPRRGTGGARGGQRLTNKISLKHNFSNVGYQFNIIDYPVEIFTCFFHKSRIFGSLLRFITAVAMANACSDRPRFSSVFSSSDKSPQVSPIWSRIST